MDLSSETRTSATDLLELLGAEELLIPKLKRTPGGGDEGKIDDEDKDDDDEDFDDEDEDLDDELDEDDEEFLDDDEDDE